ncbi:dipeptide/oligopeptide/nickel ABC transporter permease/ATP-binding protein [Microbacterium sp. NPDC089695]|uniref:dipeptide/oligopeptide/nickel ABC transporter permease/ATP-binding protein n=1 Tax=Microbacterium sp. NPDC089695 TaxID=3364198 RepID=UPI003825BABA
MKDIDMKPSDPQYRTGTLKQVVGATKFQTSAPRSQPKWIALMRTPLGAISVTMLTVLMLVSVLAPWLLGDIASAQDVASAQQGPSLEHLFGTDALGRDIFARTLVSTGFTLVLAVAATLGGVALGFLLGIAPLFLPRPVGRLVMALVDIVVAFPGLLLSLFFATIFGVGMTGALLAVAIGIAPGFSRLTYTSATAVAGLDFVAAARVSEVRRTRILFRHLLPNIGDTLAINATMLAGEALLAFASLSFLGIGVQAPQYDWGRIFNEGLALLYVNPLAVLGPGIAILFGGLAFNLLGEAVAQVIGVRTRWGSSRRREKLLEGAPHATPETQAATDVLRVKDLRVALPHADGWLWPVRGVGFSISAGQSVGLVGESGSGKSMTAMAISQLIERPTRVLVDEHVFLGTSLPDSAQSDKRALLGTRLAVVFQDPMTSFNPSQRIGTQLAEVSRQHGGLFRRAAWRRAVDRLDAVHITDPEKRASQYPHEFSGGMRQRAMIAMGLMGEPSMIVADEPTTALDVTVQRKVLDLLDEAKSSRYAALLLISHDIDLVARHCDRVMVMYAGRVVESLPAESLAARSRHPYTRALQASVPTFGTDRAKPLAVIPGRPPRLTEIGAGCAFAARCLNATAECFELDPALEPIEEGHAVACWNPVDLPEAPPAEPSVVNAGEKR